MLRKFIFIFSIAALLGASGTSCSEEIDECPSKLCVIAGGWKLVDVQVDGEPFAGNYDHFQLTLNNPLTPEESTSHFQRTNISGNQDSGIWSIENTNPNENSPFKGSVLRLTPNENTLLRENWEIESFSPRQMVLVLHRDINIKEGPAVIRYVLEPF